MESLGHVVFGRKKNRMNNCGNRKVKKKKAIMKHKKQLPHIIPTMEHYPKNR